MRSWRGRQKGVPPKETEIASTAGAGSLLVEFEVLSSITGDDNTYSHTCICLNMHMLTHTYNHAYGLYITHTYACKYTQGMIDTEMWRLRQLLHSLKGEIGTIVNTFNTSFV